MKRFWCYGKDDFCDDAQAGTCEKCKYEDGTGGYETDYAPMKWISVKDRLPEDGQRVLFVPTCNQGSVYNGQFAFVGRDGGVMFAHRDGRHKANYYAKYWMPLPEPPKEG